MPFRSASRVFWRAAFIAPASALSTALICQRMASSFLPLEPAKARERVEFIGVFFLRELHRLHGALFREGEVQVFREGRAP